MIDLAVAKWVVSLTERTLLMDIAPVETPQLPRFVDDSVIFDSVASIREYIGTMLFKHDLNPGIRW